MNITELKTQMDSIGWTIKRILKDSGYMDEGDLSELEAPQTAQERFLTAELTRILEQMESAANSLDYLDRPIIGTGILFRGPGGRYMVHTEDGLHEYTCGSGIEFLCYEEQDGEETESWKASAVEHYDDYYIAGYPDVQMDGLKVRVRA